MLEWLKTTFDLSTVAAKWVITGLLLVGLTLVRLAVVRVAQSRIADESHWYRIRKIMSYTVFVIGGLILGRLWLEGGGYGTYLGLLSAGVAIALADVLKNLAGFLYILIRRPFRLGDRVEIGGDIGDVVDIRAFRFSMLEVGNWVHADQSTGRIMHVPNGLVFTMPLANYTEGFEFIWHEIEVLITFESDWRRAQEVIQRALEEHAPHHDPIRAQAELRKTAAEYRIMYTHLTPRVYLTVKDSGVQLTGRLLVEVRKRRAVEDVVWRSILDGFALEPDVELAYPTVRTFFHDPIRVESNSPGD